MTRFWSRFWRDESGIILPYVTVMLVVFVGVGALALDGARYMSLQTQMQKAADALAIAGAAELDRLTTSTQRATNAINNMVTNNSLFAGQVTVQSIRFLAYQGNPWGHTALTVNDFTAIPSYMCSAPCAGTPSMSQAARFVEVTVAPLSIQTILPVRYINSALGATLTTQASAVAGMDQVSCGLTPMFICNPFEAGTPSYDAATQALEAAASSSSLKRRLIRLAEPGPSGTWGPGDFGYLKPEPGSLPSDSCFPNAGDEIGKATGMDRPLLCVRQNGVDLLPGNANAAKDGLNTRFGIYPGGPLSGASCKAAYPPDENVRKAWEIQSGDWCKPNATNGNPNGNPPTWPPGLNSAALPVDGCLVDGPPCTPSANIGGSTWDCMTYWNSMHTGSTPPAGCVGNTATRWDIHQQEIAVGNNHTSPGGTGEVGAPQCGVTPKAKRRELMVAIVNCLHSPVTIQSNAENVPVAAFGKFFLTHPTTNQTKPFAEFMGIVERGDGIIYDSVQLYR